MLVLALSMGKLRCLSVAVVAVLAAALGPAAAVAAEAPQIYIGSTPSYSIAIGVVEGNARVLSLDATVDCQAYEPSKQLAPALPGFFPSPKRLFPQDDGTLRAQEGYGFPHSYSETIVLASLVGGKMTGTFEYQHSEEREGCHTPPSSGDEFKVPFEAVRYVPVGAPASVPPLVAGEPAFYYGEGGPLQTFVTVFGPKVEVRGTVASACQIGARRRAARSGPLSAALLQPPLDDRDFHEKVIPLKGAVHREAVTVSGSVGNESIVGTYRRRLGFIANKRPKRVCETPTLAFRAERYVPAATPLGPAA
jgi:hypothetical protein